MADKPTVQPEEERPETGEDEGGTGTPPRQKKPEEAGEEEVEEEEGEPEIPVRRSAAQHIIARQSRTIRKLRSQTVEDEEGEEGEEEESPEEGEELTPEAQTALQREVSKAVKPLVGALASRADEEELQELYASEPEAKKLDKKIRAYMKHPQYKGVPPAVIYHHLAFDQAATTGLRKKGVADTEAAHQRGGGRTIRPRPSETGNIPSVEEQENMTDAQLEELQHRVLKGDFKQE